MKTSHYIDRLDVVTLDVGDGAITNQTNHVFQSATANALRAMVVLIIIHLFHQLNHLHQQVLTTIQQQVG